MFYPHVGHHSILLLDSWSGHCDRIVDETMPKNKIVKREKNSNWNHRKNSTI